MTTTIALAGGSWIFLAVVILFLIGNVVALYTRANVALGLRIAQDREAPRWKPGNFFGETFAKGATTAP